MKILRIIVSMNPKSGGPCQGIRNFIPAFEKMGITNDVVCLDDPQEAFLFKDNFKVYALGPTKSRWSYNARLLPWLKENLSRYDIVICDGLWLYTGYAMSKALRHLKSKNKKVPVSYVMPHGMLDPYFQKAKDRKWKAIRNSIYWSLIESKVVNECDGVLFTCEAELLLARGTFKTYYPKSEINVGYGIQQPPPFNEIMQTEFEAKCPEIKGQKYLLFLSRVAKKKGLEILIKAYASLAIQNFKLPKLVIAGPGKESPFGQHLNELVDKNSLSDKIKFPGMLSGNSKWGAFYGCEAFVLPSHQENFGIAVAEALACAKPVLISNQVNIWMKIEEEQAGIVSQDTEKGVYDMLVKWHNSTLQEKKSMAINAKQAYTKNFEVESAAKLFRHAVIGHNQPQHQLNYSL